MPKLSATWNLGKGYKERKTGRWLMLPFVELLCHVED
jgi:hypothetical protein